MLRLGKTGHLLARWPTLVVSLHDPRKARIVCGNNRYLSGKAAQTLRVQQPNPACTTTRLSKRCLSIPLTIRHGKHINVKKGAKNANYSSCVDNGKPGLFSIPNLHKPSDFLKLSGEAISKCNNLRSALRDITNNSSTSSLSSSLTTKNQAIDILHALDDISNAVCSVIDAAELCRSVHASPQWRDASSNAFQYLSEYISELNSDVTLYNALIMVTSNTDIFNQLTPEQQRFATVLQDEFERDGIHLPESQRNEIANIRNHVTQLESLFVQNITSSSSRPDYFTVQNAKNSVEQIIPPHVLEAYVPPSQQQSQSQQSQNNNNNNNSVTLSTNTQLINTLLRYSSNPALRKEVYYQTHTTCKENLIVLENLIHYRHLLATQLGYPSYAERFVHDKMVGTTNNVFLFLRQMQRVMNIKGLYGKEMDLILQTKRKVEGDGTNNMVVEPWDVSFYVGLLKSHLYNHNHDGDDGKGSMVGFLDSNALSEYFTLNNCLHGMQILVQRLFGITMKEVPMTREECWDVVNDALDDHDDDGGYTNNPKTGVLKFTFSHEQEGPLGTMYLDLHPREGKYVHAAHFTVRCGCAVQRGGIGDDAAGRLAARNNNNNNNNNDTITEYQLPIIALVCNLSTPTSHSSSSSSNNNNSNTNIQLSHSEVETLFHEFGHALHSLLSRTTFQHLSGTRAAMDFVETPSHLIEQYVWDPLFLSLMTKHVHSGEALSDDIIQKLVKSKNAFKSIDVQTQIVYALFDQTIFGVLPDSVRHSKSSSSSSSSLSSSPYTTDIFAQLHRENNVPYAEGTHWHTRFGHLVTYGAGYYGYLYAQVFAADIWRRCIMAGGAGGGGRSSSGGTVSSVFGNRANTTTTTDTLSRAAGEKLWKEMLRYGGAKDPNVMLRALLGGEPRVDSFFESMDL